MGLATPAAIAVGLGRAARNGILFRKADSLELFNKISQVVFDKTGTLTTGSFPCIREFEILDGSSLMRLSSENYVLIGEIFQSSDCKSVTHARKFN
jgi:cation transport ATPase